MVFLGITDYGLTNTELAIWKHVGLIQWRWEMETIAVTGKLAQRDSLSKCVMVCVFTLHRINFIHWISLMASNAVCMWSAGKKHVSVETTLLICPSSSLLSVIFMSLDPLLSPYISSLLLLHLLPSSQIPQCPLILFIAVYKAVFLPPLYVFVLHSFFNL